MMLYECFYKRNIHQLILASEMWNKFSRHILGTYIYIYYTIYYNILNLKNNHVNTLNYETIKTKPTIKMKHFELYNIHNVREIIKPVLYANSKENINKIKGTKLKRLRYEKIRTLKM